MRLSATIFNNIYDNKTNKVMHFEDWLAFVDFLKELSLLTNTKAKAQLISPATYKAETTRSNASVESWAGWAALDVDDYDSKDLVRLGSIPFEYVMYSTASSQEDKPKFRLVFPLTEAVQAEDIKHFWLSLNHEVLEIGDAQTKDLSRMYYIPAKYLGAFNFFVHKNKGGDWIEPKVLMAKYDRIEKSSTNKLPAELQLAVDNWVIEQNEKNLMNKSFSWNGYQDCPFWPSDLAAEYMVISETGWYSKMYQIMCKIAGSAIYRGYPINADEIEALCREFDRDTGHWYKSRPMNVEAERARAHVLINTKELPF